MDVAARLRELDAPPEIVAWASHVVSFDEAWDTCPASRHRIWLGAAAGVPVETIVEAAAGAFFAVAEHERSLQPFVVLVEKSVGALDAATCAALASRAERGASTGAPYRAGDRRRVIAGIAGHVCRGFEALRSAEASMESSRLLRAHATAAYIGGGVHAFLPAQAGPISLLTVAPASVELGLLVLAVASAAEAVGTLVTLTEGAQTWVDDVVSDALVMT